jgi:hypothetical protein
MSQFGISNSAEINPVLCVLKKTCVTPLSHQPVEGVAQVRLR